MKIIISHDVDYITFSEHKRNLVIPKYFARTIIEYLSGYLTKFELIGRIRALFQDRYGNTKTQIAFDKAHGIPSTFFVAVNRGRDNLCYSLKTAADWIQRIKQADFDVGVHGIAFDDAEAISLEYMRFRDIVASDVFGVRIHYIRTISRTLEYLADCGYLFDSTVFAMENPKRIGHMWEFPLCLMDVHVMNNGGRWQQRTLAQAKSATIAAVEEALARKLKYFTILFHDQNFCDGYLTWKRWYIWMIEYFKRNDLNFINYRQAIRELDGSGK